MKLLSAILRFICGFALIGAAYVTYRRTAAHITAGEPIQIAGVTIGASPGEFNAALAVIGLIGILLIVLGVVTLTRGKRDGANGP